MCILREKEMLWQSFFTDGGVIEEIKIRGPAIRDFAIQIVRLRICHDIKIISCSL